MRKKLLRSRSGFGKPESREEAIMQNILGASNVLEPAESNIEEILKSILYNTPYTKEAEFEIEKILLAIKNAVYMYGDNDTVKLAAVTYQDIMLNTGSTALPYEPYGIKIPILSAGQTTPVYLGAVETTRQIRKLVLTGDENWYVEGSDVFYTDPITEAVRYTPICSHFIGVNTLTGNNQVTISQSLRINIKTTTITHTANDFKTYLTQQYAAGTPVTVWYVLAEPETAVVNEPLMKIGDYADTLSMEQAGAQIPTNNGTTVIDVDTTVKPSNIYIEYK